MRRRSFVTALGTVGIGLASTIPASAAVVSGTFSSISAMNMQKEFNPAVKSVLDKFEADVAQNIESLGLDKKYVALVSAPIRIKHKKTTGKRHQIVYENRAGERISLSVHKGVQRIEIL